MDKICWTNRQLLKCSNYEIPTYAEVMELDKDPEFGSNPNSVWGGHTNPLLRDGEDFVGEFNPGRV